MTASSRTIGSAAAQVAEELATRDAAALAASVVRRPDTLAAFCLLVLNDHVLKARWPGPVTGKLSDLVWPVVAVPLVALLLAPAARLLGRRRWALVAVALTATPFVAVNLWPAVGHVAAQMLTSVVGPSSVTTDASDLLALPVLLLPLHHLIRRTVPPRRPAGAVGVLQLTVLGLAILGVAATSCGDVRDRVGALAIDADGHLIARYETWREEVVRSVDGGETWHRIDDGRAISSDPPDPAVAALLERLDEDGPSPPERCDDEACYVLNAERETVLRTAGGRSQHLPLVDARRDLARRRHLAGEGVCMAGGNSRPVDLELVTSPSGASVVVVSRGAEGVALIEGDRVRHVGVLHARPTEDAAMMSLIGPEVAGLTALAIAAWLAASIAWWNALARHATTTGAVPRPRRRVEFVVLAFGGVVAVPTWLRAAITAGHVEAALQASVVVGITVAVAWMTIEQPPGHGRLAGFLAVRIFGPWAAAFTALLLWGSATIASYPMMLVLAVVMVAIAIDVTRRVAPVPPRDRPLDAPAEAS